MPKIFNLLFETRGGRLILQAYAFFMLTGVILLAEDAIPPQVIASIVATVVLAATMVCLQSISRHRGKLSTRTYDILPIAVSAADLFFYILILPARIFVTPARARPRPAASRLGRLPAITLAPRLLPIPFFARA